MYKLGEKRVSGLRGEQSPAIAETRVDIVEWARERLGFEADEMQARVLRSRAKRMILNCTRQWGKSTVTAARAVYEAWSRPGSLILAFSAGERQSGEHLLKAEEFARKLEIRARGDGKNRKSLRFPNASRMVALPEAPPKIRGFSAPSLVLIDEAAQVSDELYHAVRPMLAVSDGAVWMMSTPFGKRGFFWETWEQGGEEWERVTATAYDCPRISGAFLQEERKVLGERKFAQEYLCAFDEVESAVFDRDLIQKALRWDIEPFVIERDPWKVKNRW